MCWNLFLPPSVARFAASSVGSSTCSNPLLAQTPGCSWGVEHAPNFSNCPILTNFVIVLHYGQIRSVGCQGSRWTLPRLSCFQSQEQKTARPVLVRFSFIELLLGVVGQMPQVAKFRSPSAWWSSANLPGTPGLAKDVGNWAASSSVQIGHAKDVQLQTSGDKTSLPNGPSWVAWVDYVNFKAFKFLLIDLIVDVSIVELMIIDVCL